MASIGELKTLTLQAAADLRTQQYKIMRMVNAGTCNVASLATAFSMIGVLQNKPNSGQAATIAYGGEAKVVAPGVVAAGIPVTCDGSGQLTAAASGDMVIGRTLEASANAGEVIRCLITVPYRHYGAVT